MQRAVLLSPRILNRRYGVGNVCGQCRTCQSQPLTFACIEFRVVGHFVSGQSDGERAVECRRVWLSVAPSPVCLVFSDDTIGERLLCRAAFIDGVSTSKLQILPQSAAEFRICSFVTLFDAIGVDQSSAVDRDRHITGRRLNTFCIKIAADLLNVNAVFRRCIETECRGDAWRRTYRSCINRQESVGHTDPAGDVRHRPVRSQRSASQRDRSAVNRRRRRRQSCVNDAILTAQCHGGTITGSYLNHGQGTGDFEEIDLTFRGRRDAVHFGRIDDLRYVRANAENLAVGRGQPDFAATHSAACRFLHDPGRGIQRCDAGRVQNGPGENDFSASVRRDTHGRFGLTKERDCDRSVRFKAVCADGLRCDFYRDVLMNGGLAIPGACLPPAAF